VNAADLTPTDRVLVRALIAAVLREIRTSTDERPERVPVAAGRDVRDDNGPYADYHGT
jgi:hypothetical protein